MASRVTATAPLMALLVLLLFGVTTGAAVNVTEILERGHYSKFILHLSKTDVMKQIENHVNNSPDGITIFAPTDNAFRELPEGTFNNLNLQQQVKFMLYHAVGKFLDWDNLQTVNNPVHTMAGPPYYLNFTAGSDQRQVNISTGLVTTRINNEVNLTSPVAVYSIDTLLKHPSLFGDSSPLSPPSAEAPRTTSPTPSGQPSEEGGALQMNVGWWWSALAVVLSFWTTFL